MALSPGGMTERLLVDQSPSAGPGAAFADPPARPRPCNRLRVSKDRGERIAKGERY